MSIWETGPIVVGHRGGRGDGWPRENTLASFERARREGAPAIELDVRTSAEGTAVVFHDSTLSDATGGRDDRRVADVGAEELASMGVPRLEDVLSWARSHGVGVNVEMKHDVAGLRRLAQVSLQAVLRTGADVLVSSFDPRLLAMVALFAPKVPRALLVRRRQPLWGHLLQRTARPPLVDWLHLERSQIAGVAGVAGRGLARYVRRGLGIGVWTVNDPHEAVDFVRLGAASIITDAPGAILSVLQAASLIRR